jgi:hypothetical protein
MWSYDSDNNIWYNSEDKLDFKTFEFFKQELSSYRFYSKCLSGATFLSVKSLDDIYSVFGDYQPRNWYINSLDSQYSNSPIPSQNASPINEATSFDYYSRYLSEYGLTLKNLFTPERLIKDQIKNFIYVDLATTAEILDLFTINKNRIIDGVTLKNGHRVLIKDQISTQVLDSTANPDVVFQGNYKISQNNGNTIEYQYYNSDNGVYLYKDGILSRESDLEIYNNCLRYSVVIRNGETNKDKQFHLSRLNNGYFPTTGLSESIEFIESKNWMLRNRVDYNNLFEINYYDVVKYATQSYDLSGFNFIIPERTISVGEFGTILNHQEGRSNIIENKYKVNLRSISSVKSHYWICGDNGILLKVRKHDFFIEKIDLGTDYNLKSVSFYDDLKGVVVGDLNAVYVTDDGGYKWNKITIDAFKSYYFNKVVYYSPANFFVAGNVGIFIEFKNNIYGWNAFKRRVFRQIDDDDEYILVDNINDIYYTEINNWGLSYSYSTQSIATNKKLLFIVTDDSKIIAHDVNDSTKHDFIYLDFNKKYDDIRNITSKAGTTKFYFTGIDEDTSDSGLFSFDLANFQYLGLGNSYSNTCFSNVDPVFESINYSNDIFDYNGQELLLCGNESLLFSSTYSTNFDFKVFDSQFESTLKSKMLFLDYDVAAKLNWFRDNGEYRLPNSVEFAFDAGTATYLNFEPLVISATAPSYVTQSEINWFKYWQDKQMSFKYIATQSEMTDATKILISPLFYHSNLNTATVSNLTISLSDIKNLAPSIDIQGHSRFSGLGLTIATSSNSYDLYLYDYLMIFATSTSFGVNTGDVLRFESSIVTSNFTVNRVEDISGKRYIYLFTEFNQNILTELSLSTDEIKITNLNTYKNVDELKERFNLHPISDGYMLMNDRQFELNQVLLDFSLGLATASYTNWQIGQNFNISASFSQSFRTDAVGKTFIESPEIYNVNKISFKYSSTIGNYTSASQSVLKIQGYSASSWFNLQTYTMSDGSIASNYNYVDIYISGSYSKFKFEFETAPATNTITHPFNFKPIIIDDISLSSGSKIDVDLTSYGTVSNYTDFINIEPRFNHKTSYYNLATKVINQNESYDMAYTSGFLKFGYTAEFNLLDYLESINDIGDPSPTFFAEKEYLAMPDYRQMPMPGVNSMTDDEVYVDYNGMTYSNSFSMPGNKIIFGANLEFEWNSIFKNTFLDINLHISSAYSFDFSAPSVYKSERMLVIDKYFDSVNNKYVIELHKPLNFDLGLPLYWIDIISRRKLYQISEDLQQINNIKEPLKTVSYIAGNTYSTWNVNFSTYKRELNYKLNTDSYAKIFLSDAETIDSLSALIYTDYKNELSFNVTKLGKQIRVPILNTANYISGSSSYLFIACSQKHGLKTGEGANFEFNGGTYSSEYLNRQYFGFHPVVVVNEYNLYLNLPYGTPPTVGNDTGFLSYVRRDPFLNYSPVDLIDVGVNKRGKIAIELNVDNTIVNDNKFQLVNVDFTKYRFRLVDGIDVESLAVIYPWIFEAEISGAVIGQRDGNLIWYKGTWECGRWFGGIWESGIWKSGDWYTGTWNSRLIKDNYINVEVDEKSSDVVQSTWFNGRWYDGTWNNGTWVNGRWYGGTWEKGVWYKGIWNDGIWNSGLFTGGIWVMGTWNSGVFNTDNEPAYWLDGKWNSGDFENGMWFNGNFEQSIGESRFGTKAYNSRTATWHGGKWISGSFHSQLNVNDAGVYDVADVHKYSIWYTGQWLSGNFYGGVAYNVDFRSGTWYGGILEDIQVIGFTGSTVSSENYFTLNGIFKFNIGDTMTIIDNQIGNTYSYDFGSNDSPKTYTILNTVEGTFSYLGEVRKKTDVYVNSTITYSVQDPVDLGLRVVSIFNNCNWKTGIWTNGIFKNGLYEGGIWYNGVFEQEGIWM